MITVIRTDRPIAVAAGLHPGVAQGLTYVNAALPGDPPGALGSWFDSLLLENGPGNAASNLVSEIGKCIPDSGISPVRVISSHRSHELSELVRFLRSARHENIIDKGWHT
jgi:hypothetical protein